MTLYNERVSLTEDIDTPNLLLHVFSVDLAHVASTIAFLDLTYLQFPEPLLGRKDVETKKPLIYEMYLFSS